MKFFRFACIVLCVLMPVMYIYAIITNNIVFTSHYQVIYMSGIIGVTATKVVCILGALIFCAISILSIIGI